MIYSDLTVEELKNLNKEHLVVLFPMGAIEQHGPHLPLGTDSYIAENIAKKIEQKAPDKIVLLPTLFYGVSGSYAGSLDVDNRIFEELTLGISKSVLNNGFRKIFFLNGHGGNQSYLEDVIASLNIEYPYAATIPLYLSGKRGVQALKKVNFKYWVRHADEIETSLMMAINEKLVQKEKVIDETGLLKTKDYKPLDEGTLKLFLPWEYESVSGVYGEPSKASKEIGEFLLDEAAEEILDIINQFEKITQKIEKIISQQKEENNLNGQNNTSAVN
ncbi:MAG: creatininase family protein [Patescibacteria group bacterium]|jgi:creatinine amidohydrolase|nr:creatininase family protein [Patescibacteria group bacterium]